MRLTRRNLLTFMGTLGAALAMPAIVRAEDDGGFWDMFNKDRRISSVDQEGNTATAKSLVDTIEPILSYDTSYNLQLAIQNYEAFIQANGTWDPPGRETFGLKLGDSRRAAALLKRRLMINGDMTLEKRVDDEFDAKLDAGVRLFQARHGLVINGKLHVPINHAYALKDAAKAHIDLEGRATTGAAILKP